MFFGYSRKLSWMAVPRFRAIHESLREYSKAPAQIAGCARIPARRITGGGRPTVFVHSRKNSWMAAQAKYSLPIAVPSPAQFQSWLIIRVGGSWQNPFWANIDAYREGK